MSFVKLSLRNARRQAQDYLAYFLTITLSAALIFAFNGLVDSQEIQELSTILVNLPLMIVLASAVVVCIIGWLVSYTARFMLVKRSREMGAYILLGLENRQVAGLYFMENLIIGGVAFVIGVILGNLLFQCLRAILLRLFAVPYRFSFSFSLKAFGLTLGYFTLIYLFALFRSRRHIRQMKIYDLLYLDRQNEEEAIRKSRSRRKMFTASIVCGTSGTLLLATQQLLFGILGSVLIIIFLYSFFISFSSGVPNFFDRHPAQKYAKTNLLVFRSLASKLNTMGVTMATISLLFTATLLSEGSGLLFSNLFQRNAALFTSYDLFIGSSDVETGFNAYKEYVESHISVREDYEYFIYSGENDNVTRFIESDVTGYIRYYKKDTLLRMSDYAVLRRMLGYPEAQLEPDGYIIHCMDYIVDLMSRYNEPITVGNRTLTPRGVYGEHFTQDLWDGNGRGFILVVPDEAAEAHELAGRIYAAMTNEPVNGEKFDALQEIRSSRYNVHSTYDTVLSIASVREENASLYAMIIFPLFYLALTLTMTAATILTIQLLSDVTRYRKHYRLLHDLGMDECDMRRSLRRQFTLFFAMPVLPPLFIAVIFIYAMGGAFDAGVIASQSQLWGLIGLTLVMFFFIYLIYIAASYTCFKRNVLPE